MAEMMNTPTPSLIYPKSAGLYLIAQVQEKIANIADLIETVCQRDRTIASMEAMLNDPEILRKRIAEIESSGPQTSLIEHPDVKAAQSNGAAQ